jgi:hypothetical protein
MLIFNVLAYSPLNSAMLSCSSEVIQSTGHNHGMFFMSADTQESSTIDTYTKPSLVPPDKI